MTAKRKPSRGTRKAAAAGRKASKTRDRIGRMSAPIALIDMCPTHVNGAYAYPEGKVAFFRFERTSAEIRDGIEA